MPFFSDSITTLCYIASLRYMARATYRALPKCILSASLLAALSLMAAGCGDDSTQSAAFPRGCESWEDYYSTGESPGEAADGTVRHLRSSALLKPMEPMEAPGKPPESQVVLINGGGLIFCCEWEIYDIVHSASGRGGGYGGIESSNTGCVRVCYLETHPGEAFSTETDLIPGKVTAPGKAILRFSRSDDLITPDPATPTVGEAKIAPVTGYRTVDINPAISGEDPTLGLVFKINNSASEHLQIRVSTNQRQCVVWNTTTDQAEFRSEPLPRQT